MPDVPLSNGSVFVADDNFVRPWHDRGAIVLQHGFARNGRLWAPWVPILGREYRVVRPDMRGCGSSAEPGADYEYSLGSLVDDLLEVLDRLELSRVHFVGESLGAVVGVAASIRTPERFKSLTLIHVPTRIGATEWSVQLAGHSSWEEAIASLGIEQWWYQARTASGDLAGDPAIDSYFAKEAARTHIGTAISLIKVAKSFDLEEMLPAVRVPTQIMSSRSFSASTSESQQRHLASLVGDCRLRVYDSAARSFLAYYEYDSVAPDVLDFIQSVDSGDRP